MTTKQATTPRKRKTDWQDEIERERSAALVRGAVVGVVACSVWWGAVAAVWVLL